MAKMKMPFSFERNNGQAVTDASEIDINVDGVKKDLQTAFDELPEGGNTIEIDTTLTKSGQAADAKAVGDRLKNVTGTDLSKPVEEPVEMGEPFIVGAENVAYDEDEEYREGSIGRKVKEIGMEVGNINDILEAL